ncbi:MAG: cytochrome c [Chloroflexota bacterium]|nr:cytochrome c [Chloroflexota bacterium]
MCRSNPLAWFWAAVLLGGVVMTACSQKMVQQPSYRPFQPADQFADGTSARALPADTVARGHLRDDTLLFTGLVNGQESDQFPFPVTREVLDRGRQRFDVYCLPCHGYLGDGNGMVVQRGFSPPPSLHTDRLRQAPVGHFFTVITTGTGSMPSYAAQIDARDRWAIAAYIRALQLSQHATLDDVPPDQRVQLEAQ